MPARVTDKFRGWLTELRILSIVSVLCRFCPAPSEGVSRPLSAWEINPVTANRAAPSEDSPAYPYPGSGESARQNRQNGQIELPEGFANA